MPDPAAGLLPLYWDQAELDRQYSARGTVADVLPIMADYRARTQVAQGRIACQLNVPYGASEPERLDIYPAARPSAPVFIFIHGGYWRALDAADSGFMAEAITGGGACLVVLNYALAPAATLDEIVRQCRAALAWVHANIASHGGDPRRIHIGGSSAGAHLAAMLAAPETGPALGLPDDTVQSMTLLSGLFDLTHIPRTHVNEWMRLDAAAAERNSPLWRLPRPGFPIIGSYAPSETDEFKRQSEVYFAACHAHGCAVETAAVSGSNHFDIPFALCDPQSSLSRALLRVMTA